MNDLIWERIESLAQDARREEEMQSKFTRLHISDATKEVDVVLQLMPLSKEKLLQIVRDGAAVAKDKRKGKIEHIEAALCIIFGGTTSCSNALHVLQQTEQVEPCRRKIPPYCLVLFGT